MGDRSRSPPPLKVRLSLEGSELAIPDTAKRTVGEVRAWIHREKRLGNDSLIILMHTIGTTSASVRLQSKDTVPQVGIIEAVVVACPLLYMARTCSKRALSSLDLCCGWFCVDTWPISDLPPIIDRKIMSYGRDIPLYIRRAAKTLRDTIRNITLVREDCFGRLRTFVMLPGEDASAQLFIQVLGLPAVLAHHAHLERIRLEDGDLPEYQDDGAAAAVNLLNDFGDTYKLYFTNMPDDPNYLDTSPVFWFAQQPGSSERAILGLMATVTP